jgi:hypothetical protein
MLRDILRTALALVAMTIGAGLLVETRFQLAAIDVAHRQSLGQPVVYAQAQQQPGRLRQLGRATLELADAALGVVR